MRFYQTYIIFLMLGSAMSVSDREADENALFTGEMPSEIC